MTQPISPTEQLERFSRRSLIATFFIIVVVGAIGIALVFFPYGTWQKTISWMVPVAIVLTAASLRATLRGQRWDPRSAEARTVLDDEFRRANMDRATRIALFVGILAQWPIALTLGYGTDLPPARIAIAMAVSTTTLTVGLLVALFLIFDRE